MVVRVTAPLVSPLRAPYGRARLVQAALVALALWLGLATQVAVAHPPGVTERVSVGRRGVAGNNPSQDAAVSADGRFVAFTSLADNLVRRDRNNVNDVFVRDRQRASPSGPASAAPVRRATPTAAPSTSSTSRPSAPMAGSWRSTKCS
jgi:hypothetical protein